LFGPAAALRAKCADAESRPGHFYVAIESGVADPNDAALKGRIEAIKTERDIAKAAFERSVPEMRPDARFTEDESRRLPAQCRRMC
jgi:hypothetical protein